MKQSAAALAIQWTEEGVLPDVAIRAGIRSLLRRRIESLQAGDCQAQAEHIEGFVRAMNEAPIAPVPHKANEQHYEVPAGFFTRVLGAHRKYSCCYWDRSASTLEQAEAAALALTCERAQLRPGQRILELGCGWGSLTLWMAQHYPGSEILAVSNSASQRQYIEEQARARGLDNVRIVTCDMNELALTERFDRVVSVEMFEHMRNYRQLLRRIHGWLEPGGLFFMHIFCHRAVPYEFLEEGPSDWMTRHFFAGGIMPSDELPARFQEDLRLVRRWRWSGTHYEKTANAWLANLDAERKAVHALFAATYGPDQAALWVERWRVFFMACAELFGYDHGQEWWVGHYLFERAAGEARHV